MFPAVSIPTPTSTRVENSSFAESVNSSATTPRNGFRVASSQPDKARRRSDLHESPPQLGTTSMEMTAQSTHGSRATTPPPDNIAFISTKPIHQINSGRPAPLGQKHSPAPMPKRSTGGSGPSSKALLNFEHSPVFLKRRPPSSRSEMAKSDGVPAATSGDEVNPAATLQAPSSSRATEDRCLVTWTWLVWLFSVIRSTLQREPFRSCAAKLQVLVCLCQWCGITANSQVNDEVVHKTACFSLFWGAFTFTVPLSGSSSDPRDAPQSNTKCDDGDVAMKDGDHQLMRRWRQQQDLKWGTLNNTIEELRREVRSLEGIVWGMHHQWQTESQHRQADS